MVKIIHIGLNSDDLSSEGHEIVFTYIPMGTQGSQFCFTEIAGKCRLSKLMLNFLMSATKTDIWLFWLNLGAILITFHKWS